MTSPLVLLARRLELAQAEQNDRLTLAAGGTSSPLGGGFVHVRGEGHPLNQALGLVDAISEDALRDAEARLAGDGRSPVVLEVSPAADPDLWRLLGQRGYRVQQFQMLWTRSVPAALPEASTVTIHLASASDEGSFSQLLAAAFSDTDAWRDITPPFICSLGLPGIRGCVATIDGEPAGAGMLGMIDGVAMLSGDGVLPRFRGRGLQKALIGFRLQFAAEQGCDVACAGTLPMTPSQRAYEACGFRAAYPKLEMVRG